MKKVTEQNLKTAFANESQDNMRYLLFAEKAKEEGLHNLARLFQSIAYAERIHAKKYLMALDEMRDSKNNLLCAISIENHQTEEIYPSFFEVAGLQNEVEAQIGFHGSQEAERIHHTILQKALETVSLDRDIVLGAIHICRTCGFTLEGEPPTNCPVCGIGRESFKEF
jgi:rubrerythrin